jgi:hypothetical protein
VTEAGTEREKPCGFCCRRRTRKQQAPGAVPGQPHGAWLECSGHRRRTVRRASAPYPHLPHPLTAGHSAGAGAGAGALHVHLRQIYGRRLTGGAVEEPIPRRRLWVLRPARLMRSSLACTPLSLCCCSSGRCTSKCGAVDDAARTDAEPYVGPCCSCSSSRLLLINGAPSTMPWQGSGLRPRRYAKATRQAPATRPGRRADPQNRFSRDLHSPRNFYAPRVA